MKDLLAKLLSMFRQPEPQKPVDVWPFPPVSEDFEPRPKAEVAKAPRKKSTATKQKKAPAKGVVAAAKKTAAKKTAVKKKVK
jgi:hypothetical protein